ncbi:MAG: leucine-rich repeat protein [Eubacterium sp.]|nr:leucine-rich repeat protein [Eubacterium sp.]
MDKKNNNLLLYYVLIAILFFSVLTGVGSISSVKAAEDAVEISLGQNKTISIKSNGNDANGNFTYDTAYLKITPTKTNSYMFIFPEHKSTLVYKIGKSLGANDVVSGYAMYSATNQFSRTLNAGTTYYIGITCNNKSKTVDYTEELSNMSVGCRIDITNYSYSPYSATYYGKDVKMEDINFMIYRTIKDASGTEEKNIATYNISYAKRNTETNTIGDYVTGFPATPGYYSLKVEGTGNYSGTKSFSYRIYDYKNLSDLSYQGEYSSVTYWGDPINPEDLKVKVYKKYKNPEGVQSTLYATATYKYKKWDNVNKKYGDYQNGLPSVGGKYVIEATGTGEFKGKTTFDLSIKDGLDISSSESSFYSNYGEDNDNNYYDDYYYSHGDNISVLNPEFQYTGSQVNLNQIILICHDFKGSSNSKILECGKDYVISGYCTADAYSRYYQLRNAIKWKTGSPTNAGIYYVKMDGKGIFHGTKYVQITIHTDIALDEISVKGNITKATQTVTVESGKNIFYSYKPENTGRYLIYSDANLGYPIFAVIYDSKGNYVDAIYGMNYNQSFMSSYGDYEYALRKTTGEKNDFSVIADLKGGETYYICLRIGRGTYVDYDNNKLCTIPDKTSFSIKIVSVPGNATDPKKQNQTVNTEKVSGFTVKNIQYKVTSSKKGKCQVTVVKNKNTKAKKVSIPKTVKYKGVTYSVTAIGSKAFYGNKKLTSVVILANVKTIGANAFSNCAKLKSISIKSKKISKIGTNAFKGINKNATITVPSAKLKSYKKLLKKAKLANTVVVKSQK